MKDRDRQAKNQGVATVLKKDIKNEPTSGNVGARENNVLLVLVHSSGVGDSLVVLDDGHRLTSQDGLVNSQGGGVDLDQSEQKIFF